MTIRNFLNRIRKVGNRHITRRETERRTLETILKLQHEVGDRKDDAAVENEIRHRVEDLEKNPHSEGKDKGRLIP